MNLSLDRNGNWFEPSVLNGFMYEPYRNPLPRQAAVLEWRLRKCRNLKMEFSFSRRLRRGLRRADFKKL
jgi:hypothetical protein